MVESPPAAPAAVWCLSEGHAGMETQVVGLAEALGLTYVTKRVRARLPWDWLPGRFWPCLPPWPVT